MDWKICVSVQIRYSNVLKINDKLDNFFESVAYEDSLLAFDPRIFGIDHIRNSRERVEDAR